MRSYTHGLFFIFSAIIARIVNIGFIIGGIIGSLLPDIDNKHSIIGKTIHLPLKHRGITHSFIALVTIGIIAILANKFFMYGLFIGYALHILIDRVMTKARIKTSSKEELIIDIALIVIIALLLSQAYSAISLESVLQP